MKFKVNRASEYGKEGCVEIATLEELRTFQIGVVDSLIIVFDEHDSGAGSITIYDDYLE